MNGDAFVYMMVYLMMVGYPLHFYYKMYFRRGTVIDSEKVSAAYFNLNYARRNRRGGK